MSDNLDNAFTANSAENLKQRLQTRMDAKWPPLDNPYPHNNVESFANPINDEFAKVTPEANFATLDKYAIPEADRFPTDDQYSLQQLAGDGTANLDLYYNQFYQNEQHAQNGVTQDCNYLLEHVPLMSGTLTGSVMFLEDHELGIWKTTQTFVFSAQGVCTLNDVAADHPVKAVGGMLNLVTGQLTLCFNDDHPGEHKVVVSYEVNMEAQPDAAAVQFSQQQPVWGQQGKWTTYKDQNTTSYIDYLVNQLSETKSKLCDAEEKLAAIHKENGGEKTVAELEVDMYNEYEVKLKQMREFFIDKVDQYLKIQVQSEDDLKRVASRPAVEIFEEAIQS